MKPTRFEFDLFNRPNRYISIKEVFKLHEIYLYN